MRLWFDLRGQVCAKNGPAVDPPPHIGHSHRVRWVGLADLSDPKAVLAAMDECNGLGRSAFLQRHGFGEARTYFLEYDGRRYDSKAIVGVAHGLQHGRALRADEFTGGDKTV